MKVDLHNHTPLCNHAEGTINEYINTAINKNTEIFGFSDHAPMDFDPKYRMSFADMKKYEEEIMDAKRKYAEKITILLGYEVDYLEGHMDERVLNANVDYLIGSVHFIDEWGFDNPEFIGRYENEDINEIWQKYFDTVESMANTKLFDIVGHLDLIKVFKFMPSKNITEIAKNALRAIKNNDMVLEINAAGYRKPIGEAYPSKELLEEAYKLNIPITFSSDAHKPEQVGMFDKEVTKLAKDVGYTQCAYFINRERKFLEF
ncbi:histidinol-phosphatase [Sulfurimonas autotrophica]|uniref:Histidinol-phosphatase n=1 Tax=Sulfurimonas autotrophica (strain ATCC BAA-671 / DSM 16294 / JCM 11897 / OK10) TaxID=563040 RepID=E0UQB2_SULAO|nr:histidinol-phosphatase [Sulfurimonas autotrophica]ADN09855.1 histidinol-phosphate phosphatase [Sulfurimonas autotrophica DSM 16294]